MSSMPGSFGAIGLVTIVTIYYVFLRKPAIKPPLTAADQQ